MCCGDIGRKRICQTCNGIGLWCIRSQSSGKLGGFETSPSAIIDVFKVRFVDLTLNVLGVTAYLGCHADGDFVCVKHSGDFGNERCEFEACADISY